MTAAISQPSAGASRPYALVSVIDHAGDNPRTVALFEEGTATRLPATALRDAVLAANEIAVQSSTAQILHSTLDGGIAMIAAREFDPTAPPAHNEAATKTRPWQFDTVTSDAAPKALFAHSYDATELGIVGKDQWIEFPAGKFDGIVHAISELKL